MVNESDQNRSQSESNDADRPPSESESDAVVDRRTYLKLTTAAAAASVSGCLDSISDPEPSLLYGYGGIGMKKDDVAVQGASETGSTLAMASPSEEDESKTHRSGAKRVEVGTEIQGQLAAGSVNWFAFDVSTGDSVAIEFDRQRSDGVTAVVLYGPAGNFLDQVYVGSGEPARIRERIESTGTHYLQIVDVENGDGEFTFTVLTDADGSDETTSTEQVPYGGSPHSLPVLIQAEDFDTGGEGVAYHDTDSANNGGQYRPSEAVDIADTTDIDGGYKLGWMEDGEWLEYTVTATSGTYDIDVRLASRYSGVNGTPTKLELSLDGTHLGTVDVPKTGSYETWETVTITNVSLPRVIEKQLRLEVVGSSCNLNWIQFVPVNTDSVTTETPTPTETPTSTPTPTETASNEFGVQGYGEYGYGGRTT